MNKDYVTHSGTITSVNDGSITLRTEDVCRCDGCAVASLCNKDSSSEHESITVNTPDARHYSVGEHVEVTASSGSTLRASWWALMLPTLLFIGVILAVRLIWSDSGLWSLAAGFTVLAVYDLLLYLFRKRLAQNITWKVRRT